MTKNEINIVWLKRDIRKQDHEPLYLAEQENIPYVVIYVFEPHIINYKDTSLRHLQFQYFSLLDFNKELNSKTCLVNILYGEMIDIFDYLIKNFNVRKVFSYQENGTKITWLRDKLLSNCFQKNNIIWKECQRNGVIRGIENRKDWDKKWYKTIFSPLIINLYTTKSLELNHPFEIPEDFKNRLLHYPSVFQPAGETNAWKYLNSFLKDRGKSYHKFISKPSESRKSCSRLSPYLAWGNLSVRQVFQYIKKHPSYPTNKFPFDGMLTRLHWHCHFVQKFECECSYETQCINRAYELVEHSNNTTFLKAWMEGNTGFPLVDANMRCVKQTGWINFRMRAMVVSVLCFNLEDRKSVV